MNLSDELLKEFVKSTHDEVEVKEETTCYGTARLENGEYVLLDGATTLTPATFMVNASTGDRVLCTIKNHKLLVTANVTNPMMTLGLLKANTGIIVGGYLTTNENRLTYDDQTHNGLTFSAGGLGAYGGSGKYWYVKNTGELYASSADISGKVTAKEGFIGTSAKGFIIDESSIYSGTKSGTADGNLTISNADFKREINGTQREGLRFALGSKFGVTSSGKIYATDADISGKITSSSGSLGNFTLGTAIYSGNKNELTSPNAGVYLGSNGISLGTGSAFKVTSAGELTATTGVIGPWNFTSDALYKTSSTFEDPYGLYFGNLGLSLTDKFKVTNAGALTATSATVTGAITAESGYLGTAANGFTIDQYGIFSGLKSGTTAGYITLSNNNFSRVIGGSSSPIADLRFAIGSNFGVTDSGVLYAAGAHISGEIEAEEGVVGPWTISSTALYRLTSDEGGSNEATYAFAVVKSPTTIRLEDAQSDVTATFTVDASVDDDVLVKVVESTYEVILNVSGEASKGYKADGCVYFGDAGISITDRFWVDALGRVGVRGSNIGIYTDIDADDITSSYFSKGAMLTFGYTVDGRTKPVGTNAVVVANRQGLTIAKTAREVKATVGNRTRYYHNYTKLSGLSIQAESIEISNEANLIGGSAPVVSGIDSSTISTTVGTVTAVSHLTFGPVCQTTITFNNSSSVASGGNVLVGTASYAIAPKRTVMGCGYYGAHALMMKINNLGEIVIRNASSSAVTISSDAVISVTYMAYDNYS